MSDSKKCEHKTLRFHSGDFHLGCMDCNTLWTMADAKNHNPAFSATTNFGIDRFAPSLDDGK